MPAWMTRIVTWTGRLIKPARDLRSGPGTFRHLRSGHRYQVIRAFLDYDRTEHPVGERRTFVRYDFLPYDDGLTLFVRGLAATDRIRLQWRNEAQGAVIDRLEWYMSAVS